MRITLALCSFILFISGAQAQEILSPQRAPDSGVTYVTGGIGMAERHYLESVRSDYTLEIEAALTSREFIADVRVVITDHQNAVVLDAMMDGPWLYATLPAGRYEVSAHYQGDVKKQQTTIPTKGLRELLFIWNTAASPESAPRKATPAVKF